MLKSAIPSTYSVISSFSSALFKFLILIFLFSASAFNLCSFCSAAGFSLSSSGGPVGRGNLPKHNCIRRFCMTASRSCRAERSSFVSLRHERAESVPPSEETLRLRPVVAHCVCVLLMRFASASDIFVSTFLLSLCVLYLLERWFRIVWKHKKNK